MFKSMTTFIRAALGSVALGLLLTGCSDDLSNETPQTSEPSQPVTADPVPSSSSSSSSDLGSGERQTGTDPVHPGLESATAPLPLPDESPSAKVSPATLKAWKKMLREAPGLVAKAERAQMNASCIARDHAWFKVTGLGDETLPDLIGLGVMPKDRSHPVCLLEDTLVVVDLDTGKALRGKHLMTQIPGAN